MADSPTAFESTSGFQTKLEQKEKERRKGKKKEKKEKRRFLTSTGRCDIGFRRAGRCEFPYAPVARPPTPMTAAPIARVELSMPIVCPDMNPPPPCAGGAPADVTTYGTLPSAGFAGFAAPATYAGGASPPGYPCGGAILANELAIPAEGLEAYGFAMLDDFGLEIKGNLQRFAFWLRLTITRATGGHSNR